MGNDKREMLEKEGKKLHFCNALTLALGLNKVSQV
jgi:hypothetical protein